MDNPFVHLHVHSEYSLLDGANKCQDLAAAARDMGMGAVALTDHGVMYGCVEFYNECKNAGVKPILGCEVYVAPSGHKCREAKEQFHLVLLAEDGEGYRNLTKLVSIACTDGFYYKPRIDHDLLSRYSKGLIALSACLGGETPALIMSGDEQGALSRAMLYRDIMGPSNFFLEIQSNRIPEQALVNKTLIRMSREHGFGIVATNDAHYMRREDAEWHDVLLCVQTNSNVNDRERYRFAGDDFYFRTREEMWDIFGAEVPDALRNTALIADRCNVGLKFGEYHLPNYDLPEGETLSTHLRRMAVDGLRERLNGREAGPEYAERLEYELGVIEQMGFPGYFCIVSDIIARAKGMGIPVGPGRGSAAGSLVAWALRITDLDPISHKLLFERFLNPERISMPDIDTDISDKGRDEVISYIVSKYGADHVAQIITFGRMMSKQAVKDVGRALGMPYADVDRVAKLIPDPIRSGIKNIPDALKKTPDLNAVYDSDAQVRRLLDIASRIEGLARHCSQHAAGIVITPEPTMEMVPVTRIGESQIVTQFSMEPVEKLGLVKMDFLGLRTLSIIEEALENIKASGYEPVDLESVPMDDSKTFEMLKSADTLGVFQLESGGMKDLIRRLKPDRFEDLVALMALYRPGPLESGMADQYVKRKHGHERVEYPHPLLTDALSETYGVILYQEQVMQCAAQLAGYSLGEADLLRRAMGKKKVEVMAAQRAKFVEGAESKGVPGAKAAEIFDIIEKFAGYGFNKSHSAAYALISYHTAYLKAHYAPEFMASYLSALVGSKMDVLGRYISEVRGLGINVTRPDINKSRSSFTVSDGEILFGLSAVAKAGSGAVESILRARDSGGPFKSLWDFVTRVDLRVVNKGVLENLVRSGAFSAIEGNRRKLFEALQAMIDSAARKGECANQKSLFDDDEADDEPPMPDVPDYEQRELLNLEKESVGIYISGHPYDEFLADEYRYATCSLRDLEHWKMGDSPVVTLGLLVSFREKYTKKGDPMGILTVEDSRCQVEAVCFPRQWPHMKPLLLPGSPYVIKGAVRNEGEISIVLDEIEPLSEVRGRRAEAVRIRVATEGLPDDFYSSLYAELEKFPGNMPVLLDLQTPDRHGLLKMRSMKVTMAPGLASRINDISGGRASVISAQALPAH
ncbi:MAG: DNA polymerase III subunit alpha [Synergistaceae bacterium]|jgi:DNA polymerase-3 subunit alpha|nr:DNA polymerase III subunit alpha [Synergistaceae bacterium]